MLSDCHRYSFWLGCVPPPNFPLEEPPELLDFRRNLPDPPL